MHDLTAMREESECLGQLFRLQLPHLTHLARLSLMQECGALTIAAPVTLIRYLRIITQLI